MSGISLPDFGRQRSKGYHWIGDTFGMNLLTQLLDSEDPFLLVPKDLHLEAVGVLVRIHPLGDECLGKEKKK